MESIILQNNTGFFIWIYLFFVILVYKVIIWVVGLCLSSIFIVDEDERERFGNKEKRISTVKGQESVEVFRTTFGDEKLFIVNPNTVYYDQAFTVEFK
ncbi:hypothetical protein [Bacillus mycoides]|uniref:hypothetical protein n=1 Tax=Bacillus mycoides TaxID=1405 RepID=UPI001041D544|nr:hypothetical protein [Bacillus mycoides]